MGGFGAGLPRAAAAAAKFARTTGGERGGAGRNGGQWRGGGGTAHPGGRGLRGVRGERRRRAAPGVPHRSRPHRQPSAVAVSPAGVRRGVSAPPVVSVIGPVSATKSRCERWRYPYLEESLRTEPSSLQHQSSCGDAVTPRAVMHAALKDPKSVLKDLKSAWKDLKSVLKDQEPEQKDLNSILKDLKSARRDLKSVLEDLKSVLIAQESSLKDPKSVLDEVKSGFYSHSREQMTRGLPVESAHADIPTSTTRCCPPNLLPSIESTRSAEAAISSTPRLPGAEGFITSLPVGTSLKCEMFVIDCGIFKQIHT